MFLSFLIFATGRANSLSLFVLWLLYLSIVNAGGQWYDFGWENQILETGFIAIWTVPIVTFSKFPQNHPPPWISIILFRWVIMRATLGPGLARIKSDDPCWRNLSCKYITNLIKKMQQSFRIPFQGYEWYYETQPHPNFISYFAHQVVNKTFFK